MKAVCPSHLFAQKLKYILISSIAQGIESLNVSYYYWLEPGQPEPWRPQIWVSGGAMAGSCGST